MRLDILHRLRSTTFFCGIALLLLRASAVHAAGSSLEFTALPLGGAEPLPVQFNSPGNDNLGNQIVQWAWSFGDGQFSSQQNPLHTYTNDGVYLPTLTAVTTNSVVVTGYGPSVTVDPITNLVANGGFETGDFTGWTLTPADSSDVFISSNPLYAFTGTYGAQLGPKGALNYLSQNLSTIPGTTYLLSFWLNSSTTNAITNEFITSWGGQTLMDASNLPAITPPGWTNIVFGITASATNTLLQFGFRNDPSWFGLDDVDVEALTVLPASQTVDCGDSATFTIASNNTAVISYQWYGGTPATNLIVGATNYFLTITNASTSPATTPTNYVVVFSNASGSFTSAVVSLAVVDTIPPVITVNDPNPTYVLINSSFVDPGATALDACAGVEAVNTNGTVNTNALSTNTITYTASDGVNSVTNTRTVFVVPRTYDNLVLVSTNLVGYWPFTLSSQGNSVINGYTGSLLSGATIGPAGTGPTNYNTPGNRDVILNGAGAYVDTSLVGGLTNNAGGIAGWFKLSALPSSAGHVFFIAGESQPTNDFTLEIDTNNLLTCFIGNNSFNSASDSTALANTDLNIWHFFAVTFGVDPILHTQVCNIFLDGVLVGFNDNANSLDTAAPNTFSMGASDTVAGESFQGSLADIAVFNSLMSSSDVAALYAAATMPISLSITSPTNGDAFTTNQSITFSATAGAVNGLASVTLYTNSVQLLTTNSTNVSVVLNNLAAGSYDLTAVAIDDIGLPITQRAHVTVNVPGTSLIDFDLPDASAGPVTGAALSNYLALFGVSFANVTAGTTLAIQQAQNLGGNAFTSAFSPPNILTQTGTNGPISYTLTFNQPYTSITWERTALFASGGGVVSPAWTAYAFNGNFDEISQTGEPQILSRTNLPAKLFTLAGSNITSIVFTANNALSPFDSLPLDSMTLSTNALGPVPQIMLTTNNVATSEPGQITLSATASEPGGAISAINFYENQGVIGLPTAGSSASLSISSLAPGSYTFYATATDVNGLVTASSSVTLVVASVPGVSVINFDDPSLNTGLGAVGGTNLANYLAPFGVTITNATLGTRLEAINQNSFSGNELPLPSSLPNLFTQVGSSHAVTFSLLFATNQQSVTFTRTALLTNGPSGISHPAWTATALDASGDVLESVSEPLIFTNTSVPARTFTLYGNNIASLRFDSDSQQTAAFAAVLLDDLVLDANAAANPLSITLPSPGGGTAPATIALSPSPSDPLTNIVSVNFYSGPTLIGTATNSPWSFNWTSVLNGSFNVTATMYDAAGYALPSAAVAVVVAPGAPGVPLVINFDSLDTSSGAVTGTNLQNYLATDGGLTNVGLSVATNSAGTVVGVENESDAGGGGFVSLSSLPNLLTQLGSNGPASFTVGFSNLLTQFSFTRPDLVPNPSVTHPAWSATALDPLGNVLSTVAEGRITSYTNVPAQTYTLGGGSIASVVFNSEGTGFETFNAALLDDFVITEGNSGNLPPAVAITNPVPGELFASNAIVTLGVATAPGTGTVTGVGFYFNGTNFAASNLALTNGLSVTWAAPSNGSYMLTAIVTNNSGLTSTSAPVSIVVGAGFAIVSAPASQTIALGGSNVFSVTTSGTNVSYQWLTNGGAIPGATQASYIVSNAPLSAAGSYTVIATASGQSISNSPPAFLTVLAPPSISALSPSTGLTNVNLGSNFTLSVTATDIVAFYYQWELNGTPIAGATNSSFTVSNAQPFNSGIYRVVVANAVAVNDSSNIAVSVNAGALVASANNYTFATSFPFDPLIGAVTGNNTGAPAGSGSNVIAGKPATGALWFSWQAEFTGVVSLTTLGSSFDTLLAVFTGTSSNNLVSLAEDDDSGGFFTSLVSFNCVQGMTYFFEVAGYKGATGNVVLGLPSGTSYRVLDPSSGDAVPLITQQPSNQIVNAGDTVTLSVTASNATTYQWFFANAPVVGITSTTTIDTNTLWSTNTLVISNFPAGAVGNYYALAANSVGAVPSATAAIEIAINTNSTSSNTPTTLTVDKFGDAVDLTSTGSSSRYRPADSGGDTGNFVLSQSFSTLGATKEEGEPNHAGQPGGASYRYSYTAPGNGTVQFDTRGSTFNTILAIYSGPGTSFSSLVNVGSGFTTNYQTQGQPVVLVSNVVARSRYFIAVDGYLGASGSAHLNVVLNLTSNAVNTNIPPVTNNFATFAMSYPPNNFLTTSSNLTIHGTVRGISGAHPPLVSFVQVGVNGNTPFAAALTATNFGVVLAAQPGGVEESVPEETVTWSSNMVLVPGANIITAQSISVVNGEENSSPAVTRTVFLVPALPTPGVKSTLTLSTSGHGKITGATSGSMLELNKVYTVHAVPTGNWLFTNWTSGTSSSNLSPLPGGATLAFAMSSNLVLQANFVTNPFTGIAGVYNGLFAPTTGATEESSGFFTATIPASSRGAYSAKLLLDGGSYPFTGTFDLTGAAGKTINRAGKSAVTVELQMNLSAPDDQINGAVIQNESNGWVSVLQAARAVFNAKSNPATNYSGRYTLIIPPGPTAPTNDPGGYGYATLNNNVSGQVAISGKLGDGTAINQSVSIARDGSIPVYQSLYASKGSLLGWLNVANNPSNTPPKTIFGNNLTWIKVSGAKGSLYAGGFTNTALSAIGAFYLPPLSGSDALTLTNGTLIISNGGLSGSLVYSNLTLANNKLVNNGAGNPPNPLSGSINPATGVLTVTFKPTGAGHSTTASGVVLQTGSTNGGGWFLGPGQSGYFLLQQ